MGRRALHTQEEVFASADRLAEQRVDVTPAALREALGGGSLTTIYKHFDAWTAARAARPAPVQIPMPESVRVALGACWQAAVTEAGKEIATIRERAESDVSSIRRRLEEAVGAIAQLEAEQEADAGRVELDVQALAAERAAAQLAARDAATREATLVENGRLLEERNAQLQGEVDELRGSERTYIQDAVAAKAEAVKLSEQLKEQKRQSGEVIARCESSKQRIEAEMMGAKRELREVSGRLAKAAGQLEALTAQVSSQAETIRRFSTVNGVSK